MNGNTRTRAPVCDIHDSRQSPLGTSSRLSHMLVNKSEMTPLCMRPMGKRERMGTAPERWKHRRSTTRVPNEHPIATCKTEGRRRVQIERRKRGGCNKSPHTYTKQAPIPNTVAVTDNVRPDTPRSFPDLPYTVTRVHEHKSTDMCVQKHKNHSTYKYTAERAALDSAQTCSWSGTSGTPHHCVGEQAPKINQVPPTHRACVHTTCLHSSWHHAAQRVRSGPLPR